MKKLILILCLAFAPCALTTSCSTAPAARVVAVQTLKSVGQAAETAVGLSAQLYADKKITAAQARAVADFYDQKFQPAFRVAVIAAKSDLSSFASPDLTALSLSLAQLVPQYLPSTP